MGTTGCRPVHRVCHHASGAMAHREETRERESSRKRAQSWQESQLDTDWTTSETNRMVCRKFNWYRETVDLVASASLHKSAASAKVLTR